PCARPSDGARAAGCARAAAGACAAASTCARAASRAASAAARARAHRAAGGPRAAGRARATAAGAAVRRRLVNRRAVTAGERRERERAREQYPLPPHQLTSRSEQAADADVKAALDQPEDAVEIAALERQLLG